MTTDASTTSTETTDAGTTQTNAEPSNAATTDQATTPEAKGDANAQPDAKDDGAKGDGKDGDSAPPVYEFTTPEGVELDAGDLDAFKALAAEAKLKPEDAQKVVDLAVKREQQRAEAFVKQVQTWGEQTKADKEIGGDALQESVSAARKVIDTFGNDEIKSLLESTGMGNHPEVVRLLAKVGKAISEDTFVKGKGSNSPALKSNGDVFYGSN